MKIGQLRFGKASPSFGISNNLLKIIAMISMACDHVGKGLFPSWTWLQMIGRLAFPIFAYMIAEGCRHTKHKWRYFLHLAVLGVGCQLVYFLVMDSLYMNILITFSISILLIYAIAFFQKKRSVASFLLAVLVFAAAFFLADGIERILPGSGYQLDYGFYGVLFPVVIYCLPNAISKLLGTAAMIGARIVVSGGIHWYGLCALPLLLLYNGERGKYRLKYLFYIFYPLHLVLIYLLQMLLH